jgi:arylsulfatase A-like enzyme
MSPADPRPNILLIHVDQHRADCLAAAGHPLLQTPALDQLAAEGVRYTHAFTPIPVCTPARASLLTGAWPTRHGLIANADTEVHPPAFPQLPTVSQLLHDAGYWVGHVGKWHVHPKYPPTAFGCDLYIPEQGYRTWRAAQGLPPKPHRNGFFGETDPAITPEQSSLAWGADQTLHLLRQAAAREQPFFLRWDPSEPHLPNIVPEPYASRYPPSAIAPWPSYLDPLVGKPYIQAKQRRTWGIEAWTWQDWAPIVGRYLGEISLLDHQVGRLLAELDRLGLADNTLVIYSSDHGDLCGGHGLIDKHFVMYDDLVRVPLLIRWPAQVAAGQVCNAFVSSSLDIAATLVSAVGITPPPSFQGVNLLDQLTHPTRPDIFSCYFGNQLGLFSQRMLRNHHWKYVWNATAEDELYCLDDDPGEITNRITDPAAQSALHHLQARLLVWMESIQDRILNGWTRRQLTPHPLETP